MRVPHGLFRTASHPLFTPGQLNELNKPQFLRVIDPVSAIPIVLKMAMSILGHLEFLSVLIVILFRDMQF
tara:strand:+ start:231 stop:440 length:210 start_codon:yes stop_codon:yes gene_type:complete